MANGDGSRVRWEASFTPSFIATMAQFIGMIVGGTLLYANITNGVSNTAAIAQELKSSVEKQDEKQRTQSERLVKVETNVSSLSETIARIDQKIDTLKSKP